MKLNGKLNSLNSVSLFIISIGLFSLVILSSYAIFTNIINGRNSISLTVSSDFSSANFAPIGNYEKFVVPKNGYYQIELNGSSAAGFSGNSFKGATTTGTIYLEKDEALYFYVGHGNWNGSTASSEYAGGAATDVRYFGDYTPTEADLVWNSNLGLNSRIMVAGGAGAHYALNGTDAGYLVGLNESNSLSGKGGTQTSGGACGTGESTAAVAKASSGAFGVGGTGPSSSGGGSGYYGGGGGQHYDSATRGSGGSGSSFISGYAGVNAISSKDDTANPRTHSNNTLHYSGKYFVNSTVKTNDVVASASGKITYIGDALNKRTTDLNSVRYIKDCLAKNNDGVGGDLHFTELQAIANGVNVAKGKTVTKTSSFVFSNLNAVTDGLIDNSYYASVDGTSYVPDLVRHSTIDGSNSYLMPLADTGGAPVIVPGPASDRCIIVDLGSTYNLDEVAVWHDIDGRSYNNHYLAVSSDNTNYKVLIPNVSGVTETSNGIRINSY